MIKRNLHYLKVGSLNCRGLKEEGGKAKRIHIAEDMEKYKLDI